MSLRDEPLFTQETDRDTFRPLPNSTYIQGSVAEEERSEVGEVWRRRSESEGVRFLWVDEGKSSGFTIRGGGEPREHQLHDGTGLRTLVRSLEKVIYLDITGLGHRIWAPLLRAAVEEGSEVTVVYAEPETYARSTSPSPGLIFDLSERIEGIAPIPGFARLDLRDDKDAVFIPMLGFEGHRLAHIVESVQAPASLTFPLVGVPGFRPEFPYYTYLGNRLQLAVDSVHQNVQFAKANCPFEAFHAIHRIGREFRERTLTIAPIGTKPHALGAVLYYLARPSSVELVYDHPVRRDQRSAGLGKICLYNVSQFASTDLFLQPL